MRGGLRPEDKKLAEVVVGRELEEARSFEEAGRTFWAVDRLEAAGNLAEGLVEIPDLAARIAGLKARREYGLFLSAEKRRDKRVDEFRSSLGGAFGMVEEDEPAAGPPPTRFSK